MKYSLLFTLLFLSLQSLAQEKVNAGSEKTVTEQAPGKDTGRKEIIALNTADVEDTIYENPQPFYYYHPSAYNYKAMGLIKSSRFQIGVHVDEEYWKIKKCSINEHGEYKVVNKNYGALAILITETTTGIDLNEMDQIVLSNLLVAMPGAEIVQSEYRKVNDLKVLYLDIKGQAKKKNIEALYYVYVCKDGIAQLAVFSKQKKLKKHRKDFEDLLNGLVVLNEPK